MKKLWFALLLSSSFLLAQNANPSNTSQQNSKASKGQETIQGCVSRFSGDYILIKQDPGMTYELQATGKIKLHKYLGQTSGSNRDGVTVDEHQFRRYDKGGRSAPR